MICFQLIGSFNSLSSRYKHLLLLWLADIMRAACRAGFLPGSGCRVRRAALVTGSGPRSSRCRLDCCRSRIRGPCCSVWPRQGALAVRWIAEPMWHNEVLHPHCRESRHVPPASSLARIARSFLFRPLPPQPRSPRPEVQIAAQAPRILCTDNSNKYGPHRKSKLRQDLHLCKSLLLD
jgi:hypothetical protein